MRPNVLWYTTDQQRFDTISALGNSDIRTPNLDRLVAEGVAFTHAYCQSPICAPSRASFLTGMYPSRIHVNSNYTSFFPDRWKPHLIPRQFTEAGYDCGLVGKLHLSDPINRREQGVEDLYSYVQLSTHPRDDWPPGKHEYVDWLRANGVDVTHLLRAKQRPHRLIIPTPADDNVPPDLHQTFWCTEKAIEFIDQKRGDRPWFLSVNPFDPHPPFDPPWEYFRRYKPEGLPGPHFQPSDLAHQREKMSAVHFQTHPESPAAINGQKLQAAYYAMVEHIDTEFGRLLDFLDSTGARDNTIVIFASDHGEALGDHGLTQKGCRFMEGLTRVPLIIRWPHGYQAGLRSAALVELIDLAPTIQAAAGLSTDKLVQGQSLAPILTGEAPSDTHRPYVRCEYYGALGDIDARRRGYEQDGWGTMLRDRRWKLNIFHSAGIGELYDLEKDPWEFNDLWDDPKFQSIKADLLQRSFNATAIAQDPGPPHVQRI